MERYFIITIDTEADNLWEWIENSPISTENSNYIPRFQELCEEYNFVPVYLCDWDMANDKRFTEYAKEKILLGKCEIGMHLHAWNTPPYFDLPRHAKARKPYLIEYSEDIMDKKISNITTLLADRFEHRPVVHRAGRWAMDKRYFKLLRKNGYLADCSVTPCVSWKNNYGRTPGFTGTDYSRYRHGVNMIEGILEIPVSIIKSKNFRGNHNSNASGVEKSDDCVTWLRPNGTNLENMMQLVKIRERSSIKYLEFMIHSSELMPGGSPSFRTHDSIEKLYKDIEILFERIAKKYHGIGLEEFSRKYLNDIG